MQWQVMEANHNINKGTSIVIHFYDSRLSFDVKYHKSVFWGYPKVSITIHIYDNKQPTLITTEYKFIFDADGKRCMRIEHCEKQGRIRSSEVILDKHLLRGILITEKVAENMQLTLNKSDIIIESLLSSNPNIRKIAEHLAMDHNEV